MRPQDGFRREAQGGRWPSPSKCPTEIFLDARAALDGAGSEKVSKAMKFMAARYAMMRQAAEAGQVSLQKIETTLNVADLFTKPLVGGTFVRLRDRVMGVTDWKVHVL